MSEYTITVDNLTKRFGDFTAVDHVSFRVKQGEVYGWLGPNGAGKTTTIRILSTILKPDRGDVVIGGYSIRRQADCVRRLIGVCPQELALYPEMSALENLVFFGRMVGLSGEEAKTQAMTNLETMGLTDRAKTKVDKFSGGMKRRINLAIALMGHPQLLFLDEPTVGIDPQSRNMIYETIEGLRNAGMTIIYTTHYMQEADRLCHRVAIMDGGLIVALDTPDALKSTIGDQGNVTLEDVFLNLTGRGLRD